jgi:hypothetical protein
MAACSPANEQAAMILRPVEAPDGGVVYTFTTIETASGLMLVAATRRALFARRAGEARWSRVKSRWPDAVGRPGLELAEALVRSETIDTTPLARRFVGWRGALWALVRPTAGAPTALLWSEDAGATWGVAPLPAAMPPGATLSLEPRGDALHLLGAGKLWELTWASGVGAQEARWEPISLAGVALDAPAGEPLAPQLRHYLPPQPGRPFALLTVLRERLHIYKREGSGAWQHTGTLPTIDHQLHSAPAGSAGLFLLAADGLWVSDDGVKWSLQKPPVEEALGERYEHLLVTAPAELPSLDAPPRPRPPVVLIGASSGAIWRSEDGAKSWTSSRVADPDQRGITALASEPGGAVWAGTRGVGMLRSADGGRGWAAQVEGLSAAAPLTMTLDRRGKLLIGTWSGLYELDGGPTLPRWRQRHPRATTAIHERPDGGLVSGTTGGALVLQRPGGDTVGREGRVLMERGGLRFEPAGAEGLDVPDAAVLRILTRPDSAELFAITRAQGFAVSPDGGESWAARPSNEAFASALEGAELTSFAVASQGFVAVTSRSLKQRSLEQLWVTETDGQSWRAASTFAADPLSGGGDHTLRLFAPAAQAPGTLLLAQNNRLALSNDHGVTWRDIRGPWATYPIATLALQPKHATMITYTRQRLALHLFDPMDGAEPSVETHPIIWSYTAGERREAVLDARMSGRFLYARSPTQLLWAAMPQRTGALPNAPVMLFTLCVLTALSGAAFVFMRRG